MTRLSGTIVSAQSGDEEALHDLREPRTITAEFPGEYDLAMGGALTDAEGLAALGIEAEREYIGETADGHGDPPAHTEVAETDSDWSRPGLESLVTDCSAPASGHPRLQSAVISASFAQ
jgi:hypothetical protein